MKRWVAIGVLAVALIGLWGLYGITQENLENEVSFWKGKPNELENEVSFWKGKANEFDAELNAPQALVQIREMHFEWGDGSEGEIVGEVKNSGSADAINVFVRIVEYEGQYGERFGDFVWVDYLRAGENKPFKLKVSKPYCDDEYIPQIELGFKTVGEYGREWESQIMHR